MPALATPPATPPATPELVLPPRIASNPPPADGIVTVDEPLMIRRVTGWDIQALALNMIALGIMYVIFLLIIRKTPLAAHAAQGALFCVIAFVVIFIERFGVVVKGQL